MAQDVNLVRWDERELEKITEMAARRVVQDAGVTLVRTYLKKGAVVPIHVHSGEQRVCVRQGSLAFIVAGDRVTVGEGEELVIPAGIPHQAEALADTVADDARQGDVEFGVGPSQA